MPRIPDQIVRDRFAAGMTDAEIADGYPGVDAHYVRVRRIRMRLLRQPGRHAGPRAQSRHGPHTVVDKKLRTFSPDNRAVVEQRTMFPGTVVDPIGLKNLLISGDNSKKIGSKITKGPRAGYPIYTLTLEERATCPTTCRHWVSCYGNVMHLAKRVEHGLAMILRLETELMLLQFKHPDGFAIRLHVLGDFFSVAYVKLWEKWLDRFPALFVFGFTARHDRDDPIAQELLSLVMRRWHRFAVRFSDAWSEECSTVSIQHPLPRSRATRSSAPRSWARPIPAAPAACAGIPAGASPSCNTEGV